MKTWRGTVDLTDTAFHAADHDPSNADDRDHGCGDECPVVLGVSAMTALEDPKGKPIERVRNGTTWSRFE